MITKLVSAKNVALRLSLLALLLCSLVWLSFSWAHAASSSGILPNGERGKQDFTAGEPDTEPDNSGAPNWRSLEPFCLNDLHLNMSIKEVQAQFGESGKTLDEGFGVYGENAVVRFRDGKLVNLSVSGALGQWKLRQNGRTYISLGDCETKTCEVLGEPFATFAHERKPMRIMVYCAAQSDVGVALVAGQVAGFMLAEPGLLSQSLLFDGYNVE